MNEFRYELAADPLDAVKRHGGDIAVRYLGGGTNLVDLMHETIERPSRVIDVSRLDESISVTPDGRLRIGSAARNTAVAADLAVRERWPLISEAILAGASGQIRNMATTAGNLLQRTRCEYFYDGAARCNKRVRGSGCDAIGGLQRYHAILGASEHCVAVHPSDMAVALAALDAVVEVRSASEKRLVPLRELHRLPGDTPDIETALAPGELITAVEVPSLAQSAHSHYMKVRDRASYAFALVSIAAVLDLAEDGTIRDARLALGGVALKPWRALDAERTLVGKPPTREWFAAAADLAMRDAVTHEGTAFKVPLLKRAIANVLETLAQREGVPA